MTQNYDRPVLDWDRSLFEPAMESAPDAVIVTTADLAYPGPVIVYANPAFSRMTGYGRDELIGATPRMLQGPDTDPDVLRKLRAAVERRELFMGSAVNYRKDGTPYRVEWSITPVRDQRQQRDYFVSIQRPVSQQEAHLEHLDAVLESASLGFLVVHPDGRIATANPLAEQMFGYSAGELQGTTVEALVPEEARGAHIALRAAFHSAAEARPMGEVRELQAVRKDGSRFPVEIGLSPVHVGGVPHTLVSVADTTTRQEAECQVRRHSEEHAALVSFAQWALEDPGLDQLNARAAGVTASTFGFDGAMVLELPASGSQINVVASAGHVSQAIPSTVELSAELRERIAGAGDLSDQPVTPSHVVSQTEAFGLPEESGALICVPITDGAQSFGFLCGLVREPSSVDAHNLQPLQTLTHLLASAKRRARDRERMAKSDYLQVITGRVAHIGGWTVDLTEGALTWSDEVAAIHDLPPGTTITVDEAITFYAPEDRPRIRAAVEECIKSGRPYDEVLEIITAAGRRRTVRTTGEAVIGEDGAVTEIRGAFQDITEQRRVEQRLHETEEYFEHLAEAMPGIIWSAQSDGVLDYANRRLVAQTGITDERLRRGEWIEAVHPDDRDRCLQTWREAVDNGTSYTIDFRLYDQVRDQYRWHYVSADPVHDDHGRVRKWYVSAIDVHERKELEEELVRVAGRVTRTLESITDGFYTVDAQWTFTYFNAEAERLLHQPRHQVLGRNLWEMFPAVMGTALEHEYRAAMTDQTARRFEYYYPAGKTWFEVHAYPSDDGLTVYFRDVTASKQAEAEVHFLAYFDPLTELPNRQLLSKCLQDCVENASPPEAFGALILIDVDDFKSLNDTRGHDFGDKLLQAFAARLREMGDRFTMAGRMGGDEFAVILTGVGSTEPHSTPVVEATAKELRDRLMKPFTIDGAQYLRTSSLGLALFAPGRDHLADVLKRADLALHRAKQQGRGAVSLFDPSLQSWADRRAWIERRIPAALKAGSFVPYYQPIMNAGGECVGAEALVRWHDPEWGILSPGEFIPVAEEVGLIHAIGKAVLRSACEQLAAWSGTDALALMTMSVNVSVRQFREAGFVEDVEHIVRETGVDPSRLKLEVTESLLDQDVEETLTQMNRLQRLGISFALDDFGTGYSSLAYLRRMPLRMLKIDQTFVRDMLADESNVAIVQTVVALAGSLGLEVVAEGVETQAVRDALVRQGCETFQGYFFSPALSAEEFEAFARENAS